MERNLILIAVTAIIVSFAASCAKTPEPELSIDRTDYTVGSDGGEIHVAVSTNITPSVSVSDGWIYRTNAILGNYVYTFIIPPNDGYESCAPRTGTITFKYAEAGLSQTVTVRQDGGSLLIAFKDRNAMAVCVKNWDTNGDGELSQKEASAVTKLKGDFRRVTSFDELKYFTGLREITPFSFQSCTALKSITLPSGIKSIGAYAFSGSGLEGELILPDGLESIEQHAFSNCTGLSGTLSLPESLRMIEALAFYECTGLTGDLTIPKKVKTFPYYCFGRCTGLTGTLVLPENLETVEKCAFRELSFSKITILAETPPAFENDHLDLMSNKDCLIYVPKGKASVYQDSQGWYSYRHRITEEGHSPSEFFYVSTDFSEDGEVVCLQKATKGLGIDLVFLGDGYLDRDMEPGGKYETTMRRWMDQLFVYEPYKSFRDWFSIYIVKVISKNDVFGIPGCERKLTYDLAEGETDDLANTVGILNSECKRYAALVPGSDSRPQRITLFTNTDGYYGRSFCSISSKGAFLAVILSSIDDSPKTLNHELGHGLALLGDEYSEFPGAFPDVQRVLESNWSWGYRLNLDWRSDPESVNWAHLLKDPLYSEEGLGVFEGGGRYSSGIFRPSENSLMRYTGIKDAVFNAPSREIIYKSIMRYGIGDGWTYDYDAFVEADKAGREQAAEAYAKHTATRSSHVILQDEEVTGLPPVFIDDSVKEMRVSKDGHITLIRE